MGKKLPNRYYDGGADWSSWRLKSSLHTKRVFSYIKFGIIQIGTAYSGVAPEEIDSLITSRIEKEIKSIQGIDKIESSSREWFSSTVVTLTAEANTDKVLQQIKDGVSKAKLPTDATEPNASEISSDSQQLFSVFLANTNRDTPRDALMKAARDIQKRFEGNYNIESVNIDGGDKSELAVIDQVKNSMLSAFQLPKSLILSDPIISLFLLGVLPSIQKNMIYVSRVI